jgi:hypothetical protein
MDNNIFEIMFSNDTCEKIDTEKCLTAYYKKQGHNFWKSAGYAQNNISNFVEFVNQSIQNSTALNIPYIFSFASKDIVRINRDYFIVKKVHSNMLQMDWRDFENISGDILEICFGAVDVKVTQATADGGLDFEGKLSIQSKLASQSYGFIEVYGQSKKYAGNVGIYDIKSFVAFANSKKRNYVHPSQLFIFFTTSDYAPNATNEMKENGFIGLTGFQLANLIYRHQELLCAKSNIIKNLVA